MIIDDLLSEDFRNAEKIAAACWPNWRELHPTLTEDFYRIGVKTYAVRAQGLLIGFGGFQQSAMSRHTYEITLDAIWPPFQGQGYGRALMKTRLYEIVCAGGKVVLLTTSVPEVYEHFGFKTFMVRDLWLPNTHLMALDVHDMPRSLLHPGAFAGTGAKL